MWTILKLIEWTAQYFTKHGIPNPRLDAELLLSHVLNKKRIDLYLLFDYVVPEKELALFKSHIQRRCKREPLQYILGTQDFCGIEIKVTPDVLIPRPETELLVENVQQILNHRTIEPSNHRTILDLCTGSGAIIAVLANKLPNAQFVGTDVSEKAIAVARQNTEKWKDRVELLCGDMFAPLLCKEGILTKGREFFDIIVSNPPYIPESEWGTLQPEIRDYEPKGALLAGEDGLAIIRNIINDAYKFLKPCGLFMMEIGDGQAESVRKLIIDAGHYNEPEFVKDYGGVERIVVIQITNDQAPRNK